MKKSITLKIIDIKWIVMREKKIKLLPSFGFFFFSLIFCTFQSSFLSASLKTSNLNNLQLEYLNKIEYYLNSIKNLEADFVQSVQGSKSYGKFFLSRPGKMRIEYNSFQKILITVNGSVLTYKDLELDEVSNLSTNTTPASFLTRNNISFKAKDIILDKLNIKPDEVSVTVIKKNRPEAGKFRIIFDKDISSFKRLEVINDINESVTVRLSNITYPEDLDSNLFYIKNKNLPF